MFYCSNQSLLLIFILLLSLTSIETAQASDSKILFIKSGSASVYNRIIQTAKSRIDQSCKQTNKSCATPFIQIETIQDTKKFRDLVLNNNWDLIVTVGTKAAVKLNSFKTKRPVLYSLIPSHSYSAIKKSSLSKNKSAIYIDQPIGRQLKLIKTALPTKKRVGVILGNHSGIGKKRLQQIMRKMGLQPFITKTKTEGIGSTLNTIYKNVDVLLAQPDPGVYNKKTVMTVLLSSYRHNIPVFGYSAAFVRSGATAAIYSSPKNIGEQIGETIIDYISSPNRILTPPSFPKYFSISTNRKVIRSLNIAIPPTTQIKTGIIKGS